MGKGDKKTRRGKIIMGTYGRLRRRKKTKATVSTTAKPAAKQKTTAKAKPATKAKTTVKKKAAEEEE